MTDDVFVDVREIGTTVGFEADDMPFLPIRVEAHNEWLADNPEQVAAIMDVLSDRLIDEADKRHSEKHD